MWRKPWGINYLLIGDRISQRLGLISVRKCVLIRDTMEMWNDVGTKYTMHGPNDEGTAFFASLTGALESTFSSKVVLCWQGA